MQAYKLVKANAGSAGVNEESLIDFERNLKGNLYKLWNRMSSGSYFPAAVKAIPIPKKSGGERILGIPTVSDRIAQTIVKLVLEPKLEPHFHENSYGYRPSKSAIDAIAVTRQRCWQYDWVVEFDIKGLFDNISHELLMKAVRKHTDCRWVLLYIERWLKAPSQMADGQMQECSSGTPQGSAISPLLSNLFLHYVLDAWMCRRYPELKWCRYSDDGLVHCKSEQEAIHVLENLKHRFGECLLQLHPTKTRIVYCKDANRTKEYPNKSFDFLGYTFRPRLVKNKSEELFMSFTPAVSKSAIKQMKTLIRQRNVRNRSGLSLEKIAKEMNPILRGWFNYYGKFNRSSLYSVWRHFNKILIKWAMHKYKKLKGHKTRAGKLMESISKRQPNLFYHWGIGMTGVFI